MIAEGQHGFEHPEDGPVVAQQVFLDRDKLLAAGCLFQEGFDVLVEPGFVPTSYPIHILQLFGCHPATHLRPSWRQVNQIADHDHSFFSTKDCCFEIVRDDNVGVLRSRQVDEPLAVLRLTVHLQTRKASIVYRGAIPGYT